MKATTEEFLKEKGFLESDEHFSFDLVTELMEQYDSLERGEQGKKVCPHCGVDAVIAWGPDADKCTNCDMAWDCSTPPKPIEITEGEIKEIVAKIADEHGGGLYGDYYKAAHLGIKAILDKLIKV